jgi:signal transduction histidine kinase
MRTSLAGKIAVLYLALLVVVAGLAAAAGRLGLAPWTTFLLVLAVALPLGAWAIQRMTRPLRIVLQGLSDGISSFRDRDFSVRLAYRRSDELGDLVRLYNAVGEILHEERRDLLQREILLATALDRSPAAILLVNQMGRVIYSNREARLLLLGGGRPEGMRFAELVDGCPPGMRDILATRNDGLFTVPGEEENETYHLSQRLFQINRRQHRLVLLRRLTGELGRREAETWKRVIRVISHELNNALTPVSSLVHSAELAAADPERTDRTREIFRTIRGRLDHLQGFIEGYARFARLPRPRRRAVEWREFLVSLAEYPTLELDGELPTHAGWFDPAQMQQVVVNLVKNAIEASDGAAQVKLRVAASPETGTVLQVVDRGRGMDEETLRKALLPFYSTKKTGTGLGLPLCREIVEAHDGKLSLERNPEGGMTVTCWLPDGGGGSG